jgi:hypothetical protein
MAYANIKYEWKINGDPNILGHKAGEGYLI